MCLHTLNNLFWIKRVRLFLGHSINIYALSFLELTLESETKIRAHGRIKYFCLVFKYLFGQSYKWVKMKECLVWKSSVLIIIKFYDIRAVLENLQHPAAVALLRVCVCTCVSVTYFVYKQHSRNNSMGNRICNISKLSLHWPINSLTSQPQTHLTLNSNYAWQVAACLPQLPGEGMLARALQIGKLIF